MSFNKKLWTWLAAAALLASASLSDATAGVLIAATDGFQFGGSPTSAISTVTTSGATVGLRMVTPVPYPLNGIGPGPGFMYGGDPNSNTLRSVSYGGTLLSAIPTGVPSFCCNEQHALIGGTLYDAHYSEGIYTVDPVTGAVTSFNAQPSPVGIAAVGSDIWITNWDAGEVGTWDPVTNTFTAQFTTPGVAGALAWDPLNDILWVRVGSDGLVVPYTGRRTA